MLISRRKLCNGFRGKDRSKGPQSHCLSSSVVRDLLLSFHLLGLLAKIKCSICSYQFNL